MPVCPIKLPQDFGTHAKNVSHGHTVEFYGTIATGVFTLSSTIMSLGLAFVHMTHYSKPNEQKHIIRILFMVPVYTFLSAICAISYPASLYMEPLQEFYEAIALGSIFNLFYNYMQLTLGSQMDHHAGGNVAPQGQITEQQFASDLPKKSARWFKIVSFGAYQYLPLKAATTILTMITQAAGVYCENSESPRFAHIWLFVIASASLVTCVVAIIVFYKSSKPSLKKHKALSKLLCIKIIVICDALQSHIIEILISKHVLKTSKTWTYGDLSVMIPAFLISVECFIIAILFFFAYSPREYSIQKHSLATATAESGNFRPMNPYSGGFLGLRALFQALFFWDLIVDTGCTFGRLPSVFRRE